MPASAASADLRESCRLSRIPWLPGGHVVVALDVPEHLLERLLGGLFVNAAPPSGAWRSGRGRRFPRRWPGPRSARPTAGGSGSWRAGGRSACPAAPPVNRIEPIEAAMPMQIVATSGLMKRIASYIARPAVTLPPGLVDVHVDVFVGVFLFQEEQLRDRRGSRDGRRSDRRRRRFDP